MKSIFENPIVIGAFIAMVGVLLTQVFMLILQFLQNKWIIEKEEASTIKQQLIKKRELKKDLFTGRKNKAEKYMQEHYYIHKKMLYHIFSFVNQSKSIEVVNIGLNYYQEHIKDLTEIDKIHGEHNIRVMKNKRLDNKWLEFIKLTTEIINYHNELSNKVIKENKDEESANPLYRDETIFKKYNEYTEKLISIFSEATIILDEIEIKKIKSIYSD